MKMMGLTIDGLVIVSGDNISVVNGLSIPESKLLNKNSGIFYHAIIEAYASEIWKVGFVEGNHNIANCLTKVLYSTAK